MSFSIQISQNAMPDLQESKVEPTVNNGKEESKNNEEIKTEEYFSSGQNKSNSFS